ncbi:Urc2p [Sporobolomyces salmoneus]|uniref:Urc2p n=1 Tax=Sporobolomyces salmoneus TaxID=183962 RepID=UPI00317D335E
MSDDNSTSSSRAKKGKEREPGKKARLARSKAACTSCHKAKQRCDGPPGPCHRCRTWSTECIFPSAAGPVPSNTTLSNNASTSRSVPRASSPAVASGSTVDSNVAEQLRMMNARLESLESALSRAQFPQLPFPPIAQPSTSAQRRSQTGSDIVPVPMQHEVHHDHDGTNAVEAAGEAIAIEGLVDLSGPSRPSTTTRLDPSIPDVIARSIMSSEECEAEFSLFFDKIQPWALLLSTTLDRSPSDVRNRSPLLFHAILLVTVYYRPRTAENLTLYRKISSILDAILGPQILSPQPDTLTTDFVRAIHLLLLYKPVQYDALGAKGIENPVHLESKSKMNVRASWLLRLLVSRVSAFIGLPSIATSFAQAFANQHVQPVPEEVIAKQRLYLALIFHESHGALQSGKSANFVPQDACKTTRLFASLKGQPTDVRLAASVELVATLSTLLSSRKENGLLEEADLNRWEEEMKSWEEYWEPLLSSPETRDPLAWSVFYPYASFSRLTVRGFTFNRWKEDRRARAAAGYESSSLNGGGGAGLSEEERDNVARAAKIAENMMLATSTEGKGWRWGKGVPETIWSRQDLSLEPDLEVVAALKMASDSLTCVMFSYPLIFLAKLANEGLLRSDLTVIPADSPPLAPSPMLPTDKLCRLLLFGADLLEAISPSFSHPAKKQAAFLRKVWDAAVSGRRSVTSAPSSPRLVGTTMPSKSLHSLLNPDSIGTMPNGSTTLSPQPPTFPPPAPPLDSSSSSVDNFDFSLSTSYQPTPHHSPRIGLLNGSSSSTNMIDPFSALLEGVSPSGFDGSDSFFSLDGGIDWSTLSGDGSIRGGNGSGTGFNFL